ncbi:rhodanese-like domain-containing protein [Methylophaga sulfidovorans]|uniref:Rhodanese-related sulfurtransferase n=1 Tax=Methylophaga sulfidovorans TaxID=45496 RepID=A0A1I3VPL8_9GAMM|nr:rhodanese-like domain-containing protein [Methylophaga sulfidovorans]SFJ97092.1 Rhodanese-related sulfurtransferase [Methylophaga sulfidovorans]
MSLTAMDLVKQAKSEIKEISCEQAASMLDNATLIDVREPAEFDAGHISGAIHIPRGMLEFSLDSHPSLANLETPVIIYCKTGGRSALAAKTLESMGYKEVYSVAGGYEAWQQI